MKKIISILFFLFLFGFTRAQYFIPVFDTALYRMKNINTLFTDTVHNYLYIGGNLKSVGTHQNDTSWVLAYRGNQFWKVGNPITYDRFVAGTALSNGQCIISTGLDYNDFYEIDGLNMYDCFNSVCAVGDYGICFKSVNDTVYVGGSFSNFSTVGGRGIGGIAPSGPFRMGNGITSSSAGSSVNDIEYFNGEIYACGSFNSMNNSNSPSIAKWNGSDWFALGGGLTSSGVSHIGQKMEVYNNKLYVGGGFDNAGSVNCNGLARWTGTNWEAIPGFVTNSGLYFDMKVFKNNLYFAGDLLISPASGFFQYDGSSFNGFLPFGNFLFDRVQSLAVFQDTLFLGGRFDSIGYIPARKLAKFVDGTFSTYAPVTTKWWYNSSAEGQQQPNSCYKYYEVMRDTFVMNTPHTSGYNCRKIKAEQYLPNKTHTALPPLYVFGDTNRIMYYNNYQKRFVEGYRYNVKVGDTLTYYTPQPQSAGDTTFRVVVDSVTTLTVQTEKLKRVYTTPLDGWSFGNDGYAQLIGGLASMLPQPINYYSNEGPLLCYQDTSLYFKYFTGGVACDYAVSSKEQTENNFTIYPNPVTSELQITNCKLKIGDVLTVTDMLGRVMLSQTISSPTQNPKLQTQNLPSGIYLLSVKTKEGNSVTKFVKQ